MTRRAHLEFSKNVYRKFTIAALIFVVALLAAVIWATFPGWRGDALVIPVEFLAAVVLFPNAIMLLISEWREWQ